MMRNPFDVGPALGGQSEDMSEGASFFEIFERFSSEASAESYFEQRHWPGGVHCPKCGSARIHRSHRKGLLDYLMSRLGADICRCHDCRARRIWIQSTSFPLASADSPEARWTLALVASSFLACLALVWWAITRFGELSG